MKNLIVYVMVVTVNEPIPKMYTIMFLPKKEILYLIPEKY